MRRRFEEGEVRRDFNVSPGIDRDRKEIGVIPGCLSGAPPRRRCDVPGRFPDIHRLCFALLLNFRLANFNITIHSKLALGGSGGGKETVYFVRVFVSTHSIVGKSARIYHL